jgi:hypothetical protein
MCEMVREAWRGECGKWIETEKKKGGGGPQVAILAEVNLPRYTFIGGNLA